MAADRKELGEERGPSQPEVKKTGGKEKGLGPALDLDIEASEGDGLQGRGVSKKSFSS